MDVQALRGEIQAPDSRVIHCTAHFSFAADFDYHRGFSAGLESLAKMIPNQMASLDAAIWFSLLSERHWHRASEPGCWAF